MATPIAQRLPVDMPWCTWVGVASALAAAAAAAVGREVGRGVYGAEAAVAAPAIGTACVRSSSFAAVGPV